MFYDKLTAQQTLAEQTSRDKLGITRLIDNLEKKTWQNGILIQMTND
jgi:hypothetical protein